MMYCSDWMILSYLQFHQKRDSILLLLGRHLARLEKILLFILLSSIYEVGNQSVTCCLVNFSSNIVILLCFFFFLSLNVRLSSLLINCVLI